MPGTSPARSAGPARCVRLSRRQRAGTPGTPGRDERGRTSPRRGGQLKRKQGRGGQLKRKQVWLAQATGMSESKISKMLKGKALISTRSARLAPPAHRPGPRPRQPSRTMAGVIRPRPACAVQGEEPVDFGGTAAIFVSQHQASAASRALVTVGGGVSAALFVPIAVVAISLVTGWEPRGAAGACGYS